MKPTLASPVPPERLDPARDRPTSPLHDELISDSPAGGNEAARAPAANARARWLARLVRRVIVWSMFVLIGIGLFQFALLLWVGEQMRGAAEAGAREATLPRATVNSTDYAARRAAIPYAWYEVLIVPRIYINDVPQPLLAVTRKPSGMQGRKPIFTYEPGDVVTVELSLLTTTALPRWCQPLLPGLAPQMIRARASATVPY